MRLIGKAMLGLMALLSLTVFILPEASAATAGFGEQIDADSSLFMFSPHIYPSDNAMYHR